MKYLLKLLTKKISNLINLFNKKEKVEENKTYDFLTNEQDWEQYNDNVSF